MAVINDPSTGNDVINDTTGNDVINLIGGVDTVNLTGGSDVVNVGGAGQTGASNIYAKATHMESVNVNGSNGYVRIGNNNLVDQITILTDDGAILTANGVGGKPVKPYYQETWVGADADNSYYGAGYFEGKADSVNFDFRNAKLDETGSYASLMGTVGGIGIGTSEVRNLSAQYGAQGGFLEAKIEHTKSISLTATQLYQDRALDYIENGLYIRDSSNMQLTVDYSAANHRTITNLHNWLADQEEISSIAVANFKGSHGDSYLNNDFYTKLATVTSYEGNDDLTVSLDINGVGTIDAGSGNNGVTVYGQNYDSAGNHIAVTSQATIQTGSGNDSVTVVNAHATIKTGSGSDLAVADKPPYDAGNQTIDLGASGQAQTGNVTFRINAYSSLVDGVGAHASVYAGGKKIGEFQSNNTATTGQDFTITTAAANLLNGELAILFDNDKYIAATSTAAAQDRNLYIREVEMINPDGSKQALWNKAISTNQYAERPIYDQYNSGAPAGVNSAFDGQNLRTYTPSSAGTISMAWGGALKFNVDTQVAGIDIADGGNGSDTYLFDRNSGRDLYRDTGTQAGDVDVLKFAADVKVDQIWLSRDAQAKIHVGIIGTNNDAVINGVDQLQAGGKTLAAADFDKLIQAMASVTPPTMGQLDLNTTQHQKLDTVIAANWH